MLVLCISLLYPKVCFAGTINGNEAELIAIAKGTFEHDGKTYVVSKGYIDSVIAYVKQDDVDITSEQKEEILSAVFGNITRGINEGYLIPLDTENTVDEKNEEISNEKEEEKSKDGKDTSVVNSEEKEDSEIDSHVKDLFHDINEEKESKKEPQVLVDRMQGTLSVIDEDDIPILNTDIVIKNTGFYLYRTLYVAVGLGVLILVTFAIIFKYKLFAYDEQS